jgi:hypothetical protein
MKPPPSPSQTKLRRGETASWGSPPEARAKILRCQPFVNQARTVLAFLDVETPSGMVIHGLKLMVGPKGSRWLATPANRRLGPDGQPLLNDHGKPVYDPVVEFRDSAARERFRDLVLEALKREHPELFEGEAEAHQGSRKPAEPEIPGLSRAPRRRKAAPTGRGVDADLATDDVDDLWREPVHE